MTSEATCGTLLKASAWGHGARRCLKPATHELVYTQADGTEIIHGTYCKAHGERTNERHYGNVCVVRERI